MINPNSSHNSNPYQSMPLKNALPFEGVHNFRDLGGYPTTDGRKVKKGLIYRSGELFGLTDQDRTLFRSLQIHTILDYRDDWEAELRPNPPFEGIKYERLPADSRAAKKVAFQTNGEASLQLPDPFDECIFAGFYGLLPVNNPSYRRLFELLQDEERPGLLQHCKVGKDRAGIGAALILLALEVPRELIVADYIASETLLLDMKMDILSQLRENGAADKELRNIEVLMGAKASYIDAVFQTIDSYEGGEAGFFLQELGITPEQRDVIQQIYLEA